MRGVALDRHKDKLQHQLVTVRADQRHPTLHLLRRTRASSASSAAASASRSRVGTPSTSGSASPSEDR